MTEFIKAIAAASKQVGGALEADAYNDQQGYNYISADKILTVAGQALADNGVVIIPAIVRHTIEEGTTRSGKVRFDASVDFDMTVMAGENSVTMQWVGRGTDFAAPDKALYKGVTSGHKYFIAKLLNIGEGNEDGEHDVVEEEAALPKLGDNDEMRREFHANGSRVYGKEWKKKRKELNVYFGVSSSNDLTEKQAKKLIDGFIQMPPKEAEAKPEEEAKTEEEDGEILFA